LHHEVAERGSWILGTALARARAYSGARRLEERVDELTSQIIHAEKLASLGKIVAGVVHELNNPLTSILAYARQLEQQLGRAEWAGDLEDAERVRRIIASADRISKFTRDLVAYARPTSETARLVQLKELIDKALGFCEHEFAVRAVRVDRTFGNGLPLLRAVPDQLIQVFVNLFTNAVHSMRDSGGILRIDAELDATKTNVLVTVSDNGGGINPQHLSQIFEPFFTTKADGQGTGLGLSIVRDIVHAHGGTIAVRSHAGLGTTFSVVLPAGDMLIRIGNEPG
jgi:signal transduction histidine kinase